MAEKTAPKQDELHIVRGQRDVGNLDRPLFEVVQELMDGTLQIPLFQRGYVWPNNKAREFIETVISHRAIGVIVTYQIRVDEGGNASPTYLADGFQRLTATCRYLENPAEYGFSHGPDQAKEYCKTFSMTVQHKLYDNHYEANQAFQNINKGTVATDAELYKGYLTLHPRGKWIEEEIPNIVHAVECLKYGNKKPSRRVKSNLRRDCYALFYQYISSTTQRTLLSKTKKEQIEQVLVKYVDEEKLSHTDLMNKADSFKEFLSSTIALVDEAMAEANQPKGKQFCPTLLRCLLQLNIWRRNVRVPVDTYKSFLVRLFELQDGLAKFQSRMDLPGTYPLAHVTLRTGNLDGIATLCKHFEIDLEPPQRRSTGQAAIGYDVSHIAPVSQYGDGETIIEPASINRARGAKHI